MANGAGSAALARRQAESILAERRFHAAPVPHPLHGLLQTIGNGLEEVFSVIPQGVARLGTIAPGGSTTVWGLLAAVVLAIVGSIAIRGARRGLLSDAGAPASGEPSTARMSAADLLRAATDAEREGRAGDAVRLYFRRGLLLLVEGERVQVGPAMLSADVSRTLRSPQFDVLAQSFDEIAYGGRAATAQDADAARQGWSTLLKSVGA